MNLAVVGVGNAGSRIVNRILAVESDTGRDFCRGNALVVNTARPEFDVAERIPEDRRLLIGDTHRRVNGRGVDGDPDLAADVAREERNEICRAFDAIEFHAVDGILVVAGIGGGTGSGAGAVIVDELRSICEKPVYALGVLPRIDEGAGPALNAARALRSFVTMVDNFIAFDNEGWRSNERSAEGSYGQLNRDLAIRVVNLLGAGEFDPSAAADNRIDTSDIVRTLDTGGISSIGYASTDVPAAPGGVYSLLRKLPWMSDGANDGDEPTTAANVNRLVRRAVYSPLTLPCEISSAERVLILLSGPPSELSRKGFETARYWLEQEADTVEVMAGDERIDGSHRLTAVVLFSNVTAVQRIDDLQRQALGAEDRSDSKPVAPIPETSDRYASR